MRLTLSLCFLCCLALLLLPQQGQAAFRVALLVEQQDGDHGYMDSIRAGLHKAQQELGIEPHVLVLDDQDTREEAFQKAAKAGYDLLVAASPPFHELVLNNAGNFRRQHFVCLDEIIKAPNIVSVLFADAQAAFLAGAAAAIFTSTPGIPGIDKDTVIGFVGGADTALQRYELDAFLQGARLIQPETRVLTAFANSFTSPAAGKAAALDLYARGADVILHCAGTAGLGVLQAAREQKRYALGMGQDQHSLAPGHVVLSQGKNGGKVLFEIIKASLENNFPGGQVLEKDMRDGSVAILGLEHLKATLGSAFPAELPQRLKELEFEIKRGTIPLGVPRKKTLCDCL